MKIMNLDEATKQKYRSYISELRTKIEKDVEIEVFDEEKQKEILKAQRDKVYHEQRISYLDDGELKNHIEELLEEMDKKHMEDVGRGRGVEITKQMEMVLYHSEQSDVTVNAIIKDETIWMQLVFN